jgi:hypothetical protein
MPEPKRTSVYRECLQIEPGAAYTFTYTNWRGRTARRRVRVLDIIWGATDWHTDPQWLLRAIDLDEPPGNAERAFAMANISDVGRV